MAFEIILPLHLTLQKVILSHRMENIEKKDASHYTCLSKIYLRTKNTLSIFHQKIHGKAIIHGPHRKYENFELPHS